MTTIWQPATAAFKKGDDEAAMRILVDAFGGTGRFDNLRPEARVALMQNSRFFKANTSSPDPFPNLSKAKVGRLRIPVLIITGENTIKIHKLVNEELARLLPKAEQAIIPDAGQVRPAKTRKHSMRRCLNFWPVIYREPELRIAQCNALRSVLIHQIADGEFHS